MSFGLPTLQQGLFNRIVNPIQKLPVIPAFDGGRQKMNTVHVNDLCRVFEWAVRNKLTGIISVAESESIEMIELYRSVLRELGQKKVILPVPGKPPPTLEYVTTGSGADPT